MCVATILCAISGTNRERERESEAEVTEDSLGFLGCLVTRTKWRRKSCSSEAYAEKILPLQTPTKRHSKALQVLHFLSRPRETSLGQLLDQNLIHLGFATSGPDGSWDDRKAKMQRL
ncbi:hypothetical protein BT93_A0368 [Corymbia citriodora subsp. variegata]|nr:hypothetical protein BT93_A0368 [Corymbia citriodora subsp. variegata]